MVKTISRDELKEKIDRRSDMGYTNGRDYAERQDWIDAGLPTDPQLCFPGVHWPY